MQYAQNNAQALPKTRTIEESLQSLGHLVSQAEGMLFNLHGSITGYRPNEVDPGVSMVSAVGIMHDADHLVGRLQSFVADFERTHLMITSSNVTGLGSQGADTKRQFG